MAELSEATRKLISEYQNWQESLKVKEGVSSIHVDEVVSKVATFYEKMRGVLDWREEHLLRKTAIERILKRRVLLKKKGKEISEPFVNELIRGGHFPNDTIPEDEIAEIQKSIDKYLYILDNAPPAPENGRPPQLGDWLLGIAACEIEEILAPAIRERALMDFMLEIMRENITVRDRSAAGKTITDEEKDTQIYIAIQKALFKLDIPLISYNLLKKWEPEWRALPPEKLAKTANDICLLWAQIDRDIHHPLAEKFYAICERYDTAYLILGDIISADPAENGKIIEKPEILENKIRMAYGERFKTVKARLKRAAFYSTFSIFLSKMLIALAIEVPLDRYITGELGGLSMVLNILIPPLLMAFLVVSIRPPSPQNEQVVIMEVMKIAYERERREVYEVRPTPKMGFVSNAIIVLIYLLSFIVSFGVIVWGLEQLNFSWVSVIVFLMFISLISFAGVTIRQRAQELKMEKPHDGFIITFVDLFSLPIIQVGKWLSGQWQKYNAIVVLFNSLLDMPFQVFLEFLEQWRMFLKEKREEIH